MNINHYFQINICMCHLGKIKIAVFLLPLKFEESPDLLLLLRMLSLGQGAWDMIDSQVFKEPKMVSHGDVWNLTHLI